MHYILDGSSAGAISHDVTADQIGGANPLIRTVYARVRNTR